MQRFQNFIKEIPVQNQAFTIKRKNWIRYLNPKEPTISSIIERIFDGEESIEISRADLFACLDKHDIPHFIIMTIMWGYIKGMRGTHFEQITESDNFNELVRLLSGVKKDAITNWDEHYESVKKIPGLGLSTYSKFLYFLDKEVQGYKPLILDLRIIAVLRDNRYKAFNDLEKITYLSAVEMYPLYLQKMQELSSSLGVRPDNLEMFLFSFGNNLKVEK